MALVLLPLPALDFDPTEVAVSWQVLCRLGHEVVFATPEGQPGHADDLMVSGRGLDPWGGVPLVRHLALVGLALRANADGRAGLRRVGAPSFLLGPASLARPRCGGVRRNTAPGRPSSPGHAAVPGERVLGELVADFFRADKPVGAICHGVLLAALVVTRSAAAPSSTDGAPRR